MYGIRGNALRVSGTTDCQERERLRKKWVDQVNSKPDLRDTFSVVSFQGTGSHSITQYREIPTKRFASSHPKKTSSKKKHNHRKRNGPSSFDFDNDNEHEYIMQQALAAYKEYTDTSERHRPYTAIVRNTQNSISSNLSLTLPRPSSAKLTYTNAHRPSSAKKEYKAWKFPGKDQHCIYDSSTRPMTSLGVELDRNYLDNNIINAVSRANSYNEDRKGDQYSGPCSETSRPVLKTQKVDINESFDRLGFHSSNEKKPRNNYAFEGTFFSSKNQKRPYFTINPEWVSESFSVKGVSLQNKSSARTDHHRTNVAMQHRRCKSAPPPRSRNPITWENW